MAAMSTEEILLWGFGPVILSLAFIIVWFASAGHADVVDEST